MAKAEAQGEFSLVDNQNFLGLVNILNNIQNQEAGTMKNHERNQYKQVLRDLTREIQNSAKTDRDAENDGADAADPSLHEAIPVSIAEIYEISNKNRKKNKARKKNVGTGSFIQSSRGNSAGSSRAGRTKDQSQQNNFINYNELTDIIKQQHKLDGKENGMADFKAVQNMRDADFVRFLDWP